MLQDNKSIVVQNLKEGDKNAFRKLYDAYHKQLFYVARKYLKDRSLAEDAVQDIFLKLWNKRESLNPELSIRSFLFTMLKNHVLNMIRDNKKEVLLGYDSVDVHLEVKNSTEEDLLFKEYEQIVKEGLKKLSRRRREVFILKRFRGMSNAEVADKFSVSVNTVKCQFYHSTKFMRNYLKKHTDK